MTNGDKIRRVMAQDRGSHITREQVEKMRVSGKLGQILSEYLFTAVSAVAGFMSQIGINTKGVFINNFVSYVVPP